MIILYLDILFNYKHFKILQFISFKKKDTKN